MKTTIQINTVYLRKDMQTALQVPNVGGLSLLTQPSVLLASHISMALVTTVPGNLQLHRVASLPSILSTSVSVWW